MMRVHIIGPEGHDWGEFTNYTIEWIEYDRIERRFYEDLENRLADECSKVKSLITERDKLREELLRVSLENTQLKIDREDACNEMVRVKGENEEFRLMQLLDDETHACQSGDCFHTLQTECDAELAKVKHPLTAALDREREMLESMVKIEDGVDIDSNNPFDGECALQDIARDAIEANKKART